MAHSPARLRHRDPVTTLDAPLSRKWLPLPHRRQGHLDRGSAARVPWSNGSPTRHEGDRARRPRAASPTTTTATLDVRRAQDRTELTYSELAIDATTRRQLERWSHDPRMQPAGDADQAAGHGDGHDRRLQWRFTYDASGNLTTRRVRLGDFVWTLAGFANGTSLEGSRPQRRLTASATTSRAGLPVPTPNTRSSSSATTATASLSGCRTRTTPGTSGPTRARSASTSTTTRSTGSAGRARPRRPSRSRHARLEQRRLRRERQPGPEGRPPRRSFWPGDDGHHGSRRHLRRDGPADRAGARRTVDPPASARGSCGARRPDREGDDTQGAIGDGRRLDTASSRTTSSTGSSRRPLPLDSRRPGAPDPFATTCRATALGDLAEGRATTSPTACTAPATRRAEQRCTSLTRPHQPATSTQRDGGRPAPTTQTAT